MSESGSGRRRPHRIWLILAVAAFAGVLGGVIYFFYPSIIGLFVRPQPSEQGQATDPAFCSRAFAVAQKSGIVPNFAALSDPTPQPTPVYNRFACLAVTDAAQYSVFFDRVCQNSADERCINLFGIVQDGHTVLYQRQN